MAFSILVMIILPILNLIMVNLKCNEWDLVIYKNFVGPVVSFLFFFTFILLGWIGSKPAEEPFISIGYYLI